MSRPAFLQQHILGCLRQTCLRPLLQCRFSVDQPLGCDHFIRPEAVNHLLGRRKSGFTEEVSLRPSEIPDYVNEENDTTFRRPKSSCLGDMQQEAIYFRGCYDSVGYLKKAGIL